MGRHHFVERDHAGPHTSRSAERSGYGRAAGTAARTTAIARPDARSRHFFDSERRLAGVGTVSCHEALENPAFVRPAKIGELSAGRDTTGIPTTASTARRRSSFVGNLSVKGVGIGLSETYTRSAGFEMGKTPARARATTSP